MCHPIVNRTWRAGALGPFARLRRTATTVEGLRQRSGPAGLGWAAATPPAPPLPAKLRRYAKVLPYCAREAKLLGLTGKGFAKLRTFAPRGRDEGPRVDPGEGRGGAGGEPRMCLSLVQSRKHWYEYHYFPWRAAQGAAFGAAEDSGRDRVRQAAGSGCCPGRVLPRGPDSPRQQPTVPRTQFTEDFLD